MSKAILNYENVDDSLEIEIFGLNFRIVFSEEFSKNLDETKKEMEKKSENMEFNEIVEKLDVILGKNSSEKIKNKYKKDKGYEIGVDTWLTIYTFLNQEIETYLNSKSDNVKKIREKGQDNRNNYNRNYRRNNHYRR